MGDIFAAIEAKNLERLTAIVDAGAPLNDFGPEGYTPLGLAVKKGFLEGISYLLGLAEMDASKGRNNGDSPLMIAALKDRGNSTGRLLGFPSVLDTLNNADPAGNTALLKAVRKGSMEVLPLLLNAPGIDVNKANAVGESPLSLAANRANPVAVEALLLKGADFNAIGGTDVRGAPLSIYRLALRSRFTPEINRMIQNMETFGKTYNEPRDIGERPLASLADLHLDVYPLTPNGASLFPPAGIASPVPYEKHTVEESIENMGPFVREVIQVRHICAGVESSYIAVQIGSVDVYITLRGGEGDRILGFMYLVRRRGGELFLKLICTRSTVRGAGGLLMTFLMNIARPGTVRTITLESIETAKGFYARYGFEEKERTMTNIMNELYPMVYRVPAPAAAAPASAAPASGATGGAGASAHGGRRRKTRRKIRRSLRE